LNKALIPARKRQRLLEKLELIYREDMKAKHHQPSAYLKSHRHFLFNYHQLIDILSLMSIGFLLAFILTACNDITVDQYEATALTTLTWQVPYSNDPSENRQVRFEEFASASLLNRNGQKPEGRITGPDDQELWWSLIPPKPSLDEIEKRERTYEKPGRAELLRQVRYQITYQQNGQAITLPTNYKVYRQVVKAFPQKRSLRLTTGVNDNSVTKAEPI
jgi:hypothetical protein